MAMGSLADTQPHFVLGHVNGGTVKTEASSSPDLSPAFHFKFHPSSHDSLSQHHSTIPLYRFGAQSNLANTNNHWAPTSVSHPPARTHLNQTHHYDFFDRLSITSQSQSTSPNHTMSYSDDYDDIAELSVGQSGLAAYVGDSAAPGGNSNNDRAVRRRSSKAFDQCRKSKCKCERSGQNEPCKNCIMLGTSCTFLGPSRKRGPPKGYIDAIEARLHQTEALLGIMLATKDARAQSLLRDIGKDPLAKEIIARVDNSAYGVKGRKRDGGSTVTGKSTRSTSTANANGGQSGHSSEGSGQGQIKKPEGDKLGSTHPSTEWQDRVSAMLNELAGAHSSAAGSSGFHSESRGERRGESPHTHSHGGDADENNSSSRRQRRRVDDGEHSPFSNSIFAPQSRGRSVGYPRSLRSPVCSSLADESRRGSVLRRSSSADAGQTTSDVDSEEGAEFAGAVGQLSLNEDEQVRYHGKASGLYLLGNKERIDRRNEGGIWRFPKARVWPPLPSGSPNLHGEEEFSSQLPSPDLQEHLLDLYFRYVQPMFPILHKRSFLESYRSSHGPNKTSPFNCRPRRVPNLLLLAMFALAARYADQATYPRPSDPTTMWSAGDEFLDRAKVLLDSTYSSSRPSTCQALLLLGYREIGIGAMAQAWTYIGMGIRMAQDLGMHRSAEGWERQGLGGMLFNEWELSERRRIWFGCVVMDKYVSCYIGGPLMIFERDFDTPLPSEEDPEEFEEFSLETPFGGRIVSCFNASATLSDILSMIVQSVYAVRPASSRHAESTVLEGMLDKWYLDLPDHLRFDPGSASSSPSSRQQAPLPNVLTLHMQYWCVVLLLHRPFIGHVLQAKQRQSDVSEDPELRASISKSYDLCNAAANHITSIVSLYQEKYLIDHCSVFLCYYVFTASIMHDINLTVHPNDPQAKVGLYKCLNALDAMKVVWPSAARAHDLFGGAKGEGVSHKPDFSTSSNPSMERNKRSAEQALNDNPFISSGRPAIDNSAFDYIPSIRQSNQQHQQRLSYDSENTSMFTTNPNANAAYLAAASSSSPSTMVASSSSHHAMNTNSGYSWQGADNLNHHHFNTPLSTAVLPHVFSTGLVGSGVHAPQARHPHPEHAHRQHHPSQHAHSSSSSSRAGNDDRYQPQFFEQASYPQLVSPAYDMPSSVNVAHQSSMYLPEQYSLYNNHAYNTR
ncbi:hypothetical protein M413DRAFT_18957 [Hebeloma cylindrosporum]|uniref:Zn(2)-C6 fungal-type domain-containing protein n=1 Tax=Hebeloma cylindrosporum TaxID=76867 RepID=A0A0C2YK62_HEBCY|nr:hypothetical protein M413DRAFT_18957 [Hebeloma cylindrosporum h7]